MSGEVSNEHLIEVARKAARTGSAILTKAYDSMKKGSQSLVISEKTSYTDLVTDIDQEAQQAVIAAIQKDFPEHRFLAEEEGADELGNAASEYEWVIDPLDGTVNFIHGKTWFGTIVSVRKNGETVAGAMYMPLLDMEFWGGRGSGAYYNGDTVKLRKTRDMRDAVLSCNTIRRAKDINGTLHVTVPPCASVENYGCALLELGEILLGHADGVFFDGIRLWDIAAGFMLVEEAGGTARMKAKEPKNPRGGYIAAATTAPIFDELWEWMEKKM